MTNPLHSALLAAADQSLQVTRDGVEDLVRTARTGLAMGKDRTEVVAAMNLAILTMALGGMSTSELLRGLAVAVVRIAELPEAEPVMHREVPDEQWRQLR